MEGIENQSMQGEVTEVSGSRARVMFPDRDNMTSGLLPVLQMFTGANKSIRMPSIGEEVVCLFFATGLEDGVILGSVYVDGNEPPADNNAIEFEDGGLIKYENGKLTIKAELDVQGPINSTETITAVTDVLGGGKSLKGHTNGGRGVD